VVVSRFAWIVRRQEMESSIVERQPAVGQALSGSAMHSDPRPRLARGADRSSSAYGDPIDIKNLISIIRRRKAIVLWTVCLVTGLAALIVALLTPHYTATSVVMIEPRPARVIDLKAVVGDLAPDEATVETQIRVLASRELAERVVRQFDLVSDPEFNPAVLPDAEGTVGALAAEFATWWHEYWPTSEGVARQLQPDAREPVLAQADPAGVPVASPLETAVATFLKNLEVSRSDLSHVISIDFTSTDREKAARIANAVAQSYVDNQLAQKRTATTEATEWLTQRVEELRQRVLKADRAVEEYRTANQLTDEGTSLNGQQLATLNATLIGARAELAEKEARLERAREVLKTGGYDAIAEEISSPVIAMLREQETTLLRRKAQLSREYGDRHPSMLQLEAERQNLETRIDQEARNTIRTLENEVAVARRRESALERSLDDAKAQSAVISRAGIELAELEREAAADRTIYESFLTRLKETNEQQGLLQPDAHVISAAFVPRVPSFPKPKLMIISGLVASLMMGLLLALLTEHLDRSLCTGGHLERQLGVNSLGLVPSVRRLKRRQKHHQYLLEKPLSEYAEAVRSIRKALELSNIDRPPRVVMVTSTLPREGKTTLAASLAASNASSGFNTILVDLDLRHPSVAREMAQPVKADLIDFMTGKATLEEVIHSNPSSDKLAYIPIKQLTRTPMNLLESQKMSSLIADLRARYDYVVLDTPPTLGITDPRATALLADAVLFVVRWQETKAEPALRGLEILHESHVRVAGAVLTQVNLRRLAKLSYGEHGAYYKSYRTYYQN
jgi:polysaccharide biosynthesis transport protein